MKKKNKLSDNVTGENLSLLPEEVKAEDKSLSPTENYKKFVERFNEIFKKRHRVLPDMVSKLKTRMKTFSFDEVMTALEGLGSWDFAHGNNDRNWKATPDFLLRNDAQIDRFLNLDPQTEGNSQSPTLFPQGFERLDKRLETEAILLAELTTGVWDTGVKYVYGQKLIPWLKSKNYKTDFDTTSKLLISFIRDLNLASSELSLNMILSDYEKYLKTCEFYEIEPRFDIFLKGEQLRLEKQE